MNKNPASIDMIKVVAHALGDLNPKGVYVGGATVPLYIPQQYWPQARPTEDIDIVMEIVGRREGWVNDEVLRRKGFEHDISEGAPICRWLYKGLKVDIMSPDPSITGFTNKWYEEGVERSKEVDLKAVRIRIFTTLYFLASKIEAFKSRGKGDFTGSKDMEDIISILEVHAVAGIETDLAMASVGLKKYLIKEFQSLQKNDGFLDALPGAVFNRQNPMAGAQAVKDKIQRMFGQA